MKKENYGNWSRVKNIMSSRSLPPNWNWTNLRSNPAVLGIRYAREKYLMKKDNEDLFRIR